VGSEQSESTVMLQTANISVLHTIVDQFQGNADHATVR